MLQLPEFRDSTCILNWLIYFSQLHHSGVLHRSHRIYASSCLLPALQFERVWFEHTGPNWKSRILFFMLQYSPEKLFKLWHGSSCFAFHKKCSGFIFFLILFLCSTLLFKNQLKQIQMLKYFLPFSIICRWHVIV